MNMDDPVKGRRNIVKFKTRFKSTFRAITLLLAACFTGSYTPSAQAISIYDAVLNANVLFNIIPGLQFFIGFGDPIIPIINDPDGAGPSFADAGGNFAVNGSNDGFSASAFAFGSASPSGGGGSLTSDSLASVTGQLVNITGFEIQTTGTVSGDFFVGGSVADPLSEIASAGILLDFSFPTSPDPFISSTVSAPSGTDLAVTDTLDPFNFNITVPAFSSTFFLFEARAFGSATGAVEGQPEPIGRFPPLPVPEPGTLALFGIGLIVLVYMGRRRKTAEPLSA